MRGEREGVTAMVGKRKSHVVLCSSTRTIERLRKKKEKEGEGATSSRA